MDPDFPNLWKSAVFEREKSKSIDMGKAIS